MPYNSLKAVRMEAEYDEPKKKATVDLQVLEVEALF